MIMPLILDFADALANPIQYVSEDEKRSQQLEALLMDEEATAESSTTAEPVVQRVKTLLFRLLIKLSLNQ